MNFSDEEFQNININEKEEKEKEEEKKEEGVMNVDYTLYYVSDQSSETSGIFELDARIYQIPKMIIHQNFLIKHMPNLWS